MKVKLITHTPNPEQTIAVAARLCYSPATIDEVSEKLTPEKAAKFVEMLGDLGHDSPVEHVTFTFGIEEVSRSLLAEITRHRIASFSVQSQRYVAESNFSYVTPPAIADIPEAAEEFQRAMAEDQAHYERLADMLRAKHRTAFEAEGMTPEAAAKAAEKRAIEDARFVLPNACTTKIIMTMNVRSLRNFFHLRCCNRAQWEIRALATEMLRLCYEVAPHLFAKSGPSCVSGPCPEGKMCCGKTAEVRAAFAALKE